METIFLEREDVTLAVHDFGGSGDSVLIAHATGFHGRAYRAFAELLVETHHVVAVDLRAHGASTAPASVEGLSWESMAKDIAAVIEWLDAPVVHGFGHSMGGGAILGAQRAKPSSFTSAFLFEPIVPPEGSARPTSRGVHRYAEQHLTLTPTLFCDTRLGHRWECCVPMCSMTTSFTVSRPSATAQ